MSNNSAPQPGGRMPDATEEDYFYYVMELADDQTRGQQIDPDSYAPRTLSSEMNQHGRLPISECLEIALALSGALEHLHKNGLVHRDVKPSNVIFVNGIPKLADIGLVTDTAATMSFVGTEGFFPPEGPGSPQADIYSLGKVLYEISTGKDRKDFPEPPTLLGEFTDREELLEFGEVVKRACAKDLRERYASAETMQSDLLLLKTGKSVHQTHRLERRLKIATRVGIAAGVIAVLALGAYFFAENQTRKAQEISKRETELRKAAEASEKKAETEAAKSRQVAKFMTEMLNGVGPSAAMGRDTEMLREILDATAKRIRKDLADQPQVEAELRLTIGKVYLELKLISQAEAMFRSALANWRVTNGHEDKVADVLNQLAIALRNQGKSQEAEAALNEALALGKKFLGDEHPAIATSLHLLAGLVRNNGKLTDAETLQRQALEMQRKLFGNEHDDVASSLRHLALVFSARGKPEMAEPLHREALAIYRKLHGNDHPGTAWCLTLLGDVLGKQNKLAEAISVSLEALESHRKLQDSVFIRRTADTLLTLARRCERDEGISKDEIDIGTLYRKVAEQYREDAERGDVNAQLKLAGMYESGKGVAKDPGEAAKWYRVVETGNTNAQVKAVSPTTARLANALWREATALIEQNELPEAEALFRQSLKAGRPIWGSDHTNMATVLSSLGHSLCLQNKFGEAESFYRECLAIREKNVPDAWYTFYTRGRLGETLLGQQKFAEAEPLLLTGYEGMKQRETNIPNRRILFSEIIQPLIKLYEATGRPDIASEWKKRLSEFGADQLDAKAISSKP